MSSNYKKKIVPKNTAISIKYNGSWNKDLTTWTGSVNDGPIILINSKWSQGVWNESNYDGVFYNKKYGEIGIKWEQKLKNGNIWTGEYEYIVLIIGALPDEENNFIFPIKPTKIYYVKNLDADKKFIKKYSQYINDLSENNDNIIFVEEFKKLINEKEFKSKYENYFNLIISNKNTSDNFKTFDLDTMFDIRKILKDYGRCILEYTTKKIDKNKFIDIPKIYINGDMTDIESQIAKMSDKKNIDKLLYEKGYTKDIRDWEIKLRNIEKHDRKSYPKNPLHRLNIFNGELILDQYSTEYQKRINGIIYDNEVITHLQMTICYDVYKYWSKNISNSSNKIHYIDLFKIETYG